MFVVILVSACGGTLFQNSSDSGGSSPTSECRVVKHAMGKACVPFHPQRVVALAGLENALALEVKPVGGSSLDGKASRDNPYFAGKLTGIQDVGTNESPSFETIFALKPDLILAIYPYQQQLYSQLKQIAPTVMVEMQGSKDWEKGFMKQAEALGKQEEAEKLMADYYARLERFKEQMGDRLNQIEVSVVRPYHTGEFLLYTVESFVAEILKDAGLRHPSRQNQPNLDGYLTRESIPYFDADIIFVWTWGYTPKFAQDAEELLESLKTDPIWLQLEAVKVGSVYEVPAYWMGDSILDAYAVVDDLFKYLVENQPEFLTTTASKAKSSAVSPQ